MQGKKQPSLWTWRDDALLCLQVLSSEHWASVPALSGCQEHPCTPSVSTSVITDLNFCLSICIFTHFKFKWLANWFTHHAPAHSLVYHSSLQLLLWRHSGGANFPPCSWPLRGEEGTVCHRWLCGLEMDLGILMYFESGWVGIGACEKRAGSRIQKIARMNS